MAMMPPGRGGDIWDAVSALNDPNMQKVLLYLLRTRSAAVPKIAFDLQMPAPEASETIRQLMEHGLVREAGGGAMAKGQMKQAPAPGLADYYILSERGLEAARLIGK